MQCFFICFGDPANSRFEGTPAELQKKHIAFDMDCWTERLVLVINFYAILHSSVSMLVQYQFLILNNSDLLFFLRAAQFLTLKIVRNKLFASNV